MRVNSFFYELFRLDDTFSLQGECPELIFIIFDCQMLPYIAPFAIYILLSLLASSFEYGSHFIYPIKTVAVAGCLWFYRREFEELHQRISVRQGLIAVLVGTAVFVVWIAPEGLYPHLGESEFNPAVFDNSAAVWILVAFRLTGAALVVPVFEELFWRSFLLRWMIAPDFRKVELGKFTWMSFVVVTVLFGLEHHRWLVGLAAGAVYNGLIYRERNLWVCVLAHAATNLALGIYLLQTQQWGFW